MVSSVLHTYGIDDSASVENLTGGLINSTWKVAHAGKQFILQKINVQVFKNPYDLAENIRMINKYLKENAPKYLFVNPIKNTMGQDIVHDSLNGYFRLLPFVSGSHTIDVVASPKQAYEAAFQFGKFTQLLSGFDATQLHITIRDFHNLTLRYSQFEASLKNGNTNRIGHCAELINELKTRVVIVEEFEQLKKNTDVRQRVTHHDTKISNVLFDSMGNGMCVIDLDTIMPGYFISDLGDMMRTYLSPANEEVKDFTKIAVREDFFRAIVHGYTEAMGQELTEAEKGLIIYSASFLTYMQALRFLTDYFNNDIYYGAKYEEHNLVRAGNQVELLKRIEEKKELLNAIILDEVF